MGRTHPNLVGHWRFENTLDDSSGNGNNGTVGAGSAAYAAGKIGRAWDNDATRYITIPETFKTESVSFAFWYKTESIVFAKSIISDRSNSRAGFIIWEDINGFMAFDYHAANALERWTTNYALSTSVWQHIVFTRDPNGRKLYVNGKLQDSTSDAGSMTQSANNFTSIMARADNLSTRTIGQLDDVQIWNRALAPHQIAAIYNGVDPAFIGDIA